MSTNLQRNLLERRQFGRLATPKYKSKIPTFDEQVYSDGFIISQMTLKKSLTGHTGCVNTLDWSLDGNKLLSGSDDTKLNIYSSFEDYKLSTVIDTGHRANIFTAKFMPQTSENIIISGAGDSEIRIFDLHNIENPLISMYVCHSDQIKKICVYNNSPNEFLTCSQDGTVRHFDIRVPHLCSPHSVRSFLTAQNKPARQYPLPSGERLRTGCFRPIVDYSKYNIELNSMAINNLYPHYFAVAGTSDYIFLHDRRMLQTTSNAHQSTSDSMSDLNCVERFSPRSDEHSRPNKHVTSCKFSDSNGYELIGSWSSDAIYLFNINECVLDRDSLTTNSATASNTYKRSKHTHFTKEINGSITASIATKDSSKEIDVSTLWKKITYSYTKYDLPSALSYSEKLLHFLKSLDSIDANIGKSCGYMIFAAVLTAYENLGSSSYTTSTVTKRKNHDEIRERIEKAENITPQIWYGLWCKAIGYWLLGGGYISNGCDLRENYLKTSLKYAQDSQSTLQDQVDSHESSSTIIEVSPDDTSQIYLDMINKFIMDINTVLILEGFVDNDEQSVFSNLEGIKNEHRRYEWINFMYITRLPPNISELSTLVSTMGLSSSCSTPEEIHSISEDDDGNNTNITSSTDTGDEEEQEDYTIDDDDDEQSFYDRFINPRILDIYNSESEFDNLYVNRKSLSFDNNIGLGKPKSAYMGHCNIETVKEVDFFGLNDEFIVSGSDEGYLFIWNKKTANIVQILRADEEVVNVAKGHPYLPLLAVSGIDSTVKIFEPTSRLPSTSKIQYPNNPRSYSSSSRLYKCEEIIETNSANNDNLDDDVYITRALQADILRLERQGRLTVTNGMISVDDAEEEESDD